MNTTIINKCIEELRKDKPKIDYVLGMLEAVAAMEDEDFDFRKSQIIKVPANPLGTPLPLSGGTNITFAPTDEAAILDAKARAAIAKVREMSHE